MMIINTPTAALILRDDNFERSGCTSISFEQRSSFLLYIRVTDNGFQNKNKLSGTGKITVKINDVNEAPRFLSQERTVDEQTPGRNPAANYNGQCGAPLSATDEDGDMVRFNITDAAASQPEFPFGVDAVSGQISVRVDNVLDFEGPQNTFKFEVTCYDVSPGKESKYTRATVTILLQDVNENPVVEEEYFQIPEDFSTVSKIGRVNVFDVDAGQEVFRSIVSGNTHDAFRMVRDGTLFVMEDGILNFEQYERQYFKLLVRGRDTGDGALVHEAYITINVTDVNEPPWFPKDHVYSRQIVENSEAGTAAGDQIPSGDDDHGDSRSFSVDRGQGSGAQVFDISETAAILTLASGNSLNFENVRVYTVYVTAKDTGGLTATVAIRVELLDIKDRKSVV